MSSVASGPPPGLGYIRMPIDPANGFQIHVLEAWGRMDGEQPLLGFRVLPHHCNPRGVCHGGMLLTFCDYLLPTLARLTNAQDDSFTPTVSLSANFLAPARLGDWLEGHARTLRRSTNLVFVDGLVSDNIRPVLQASGIFKRGNQDGRRAGSAALLERLRQASDRG